MTKASLSLLGIALSTFASLSVAQAGPPQAGSNELRLEGSYLLPTYSINGLTVQTRDGAKDWRLFGASFAYGRFLTDNLEIGSSLTALYSGTGDHSQTGFGLSPFLRLLTMLNSTVGLFGSATGGFLIVSPDEGDNTTVLTLGADAGAEFFIGDSWSLRVGPTYRYLDLRANDQSDTEHVYGANWAIAGYF